VTGYVIDALEIHILYMTIREASHGYIIYMYVFLASSDPAYASSLVFST